MSIIEALKAMQAKLMGATGAVHAEIGNLRTRIQAARRELQQLHNAPVPRDEIRERVAAVVSERGARWLREHGNELFTMALPGWRPLGAYGERGKLRLPDSTDFLGFIAALMPDFAQRLLDALPDVVNYQPGPPSATRPGLIARLERELADLESFEESAIDEAATAGVAIAHRPEVLRRRQNEARARELAETAVADRRRRQEAIDAEAQPRIGASEYLSSERAVRPLKLS